MTIVGFWLSYLGHGFHTREDLKFIWLTNLLTLNVPDECYSTNVLCISQEHMTTSTEFSLVVSIALQ